MNSSLTAPRVVVESFGELPDGTPVERYGLANGDVELDAITYGGIITSIRTPDRSRVVDDVVLGFDRLDGYLDNEPYLGAIIGRYANRIAHGRFALDGVEYQLARNQGGNHLHGGRAGFDRKLWSAAPISLADAAGVSFSRTSPAGEEGYPGTLRVDVTYLITPEGTIVLTYQAVTDAPTIVNLTQHTYFNLAGRQSTSVLDHEVTIRGDQFTPVDATLIPTGELADVTGGPFDLRQTARLGERLQHKNDQLAIGRGFDHNWVLTRPTSSEPVAARLRDPSSGRALDVSTSEPGLQLYCGQMLDGRPGAYGRRLGPHCGLCLETQHFPDSPNRPQFPSTVLRPGEVYRSTTRWRFSAGDHDRNDG